MAARELIVPPPAASDPQSYEMLRLWMAGDGSQSLTIHADPGLDPAAWGIVLIDVARHAAHAYAQRGVGTVADNYARILAGLIAELQGPSGGPDTSGAPVA
jgi:hypothetical protein